MPLLAPQALTAPGRKAAQRYTLIDLNTFTDHRSLADNDTGTVVDKEICADSGTGVDIDAGDAVGILCHHTGNHGHIQHIQFMGKTVDRNGKQAGVRENDLIIACCGRVAVVGRLQIRLHQTADLGDLSKKCQCQVLRPGLPVGIFRKHQCDLAAQVEHHILHQHGKIMLGIVDPVILLFGIAGEYDPVELGYNILYHILVRMAGLLDLVDIPVVAVVLQNQIHHIFNLLVDGCHGLCPLSFFTVIP